jgi:hypothetical protein
MLLDVVHAIHLKCNLILLFILKKVKKCNSFSLGSVGNNKCGRIHVRSFDTYLVCLSNDLRLFSRSSTIQQQSRRQFTYFTVPLRDINFAVTAADNDIFTKVEHRE